MARPSKLTTHPKDMVLKALRKSKMPMTAYSLLSKLNPLGVKSAPIVYRALDALEHSGKVHKIKELGAYVACDCTADHVHHLSVLTVCTGCKKVEELHDHKVIDYLAGLRNFKINLPEIAAIELPVTCRVCAAH